MAQPMLQRPGIQGTLALANLTSLALLTGVPLVKTDLPKPFYVVLLVVVLVCQVGQIYAAVVAQRELVDLRAATRTPLDLTVKQALRLLVREVCANDVLLRRLDVDLSWAARLTTAEGACLVELDGSDIGLDHLDPIDVSSRRVRKIKDPPDSVQCPAGNTLYGAGDVQGATGLRFEVFYALPDSVNERDGTPLGHVILDRLTKDDLLVFVTTRLVA